MMGRQYLSYEKYLSFGGTLSEVPFRLSEFKARKLIDQFTQGRLINLPEQKENVKICIFELINDMQNNSSVASSESTDGYSISYKESKEINKARTDIIFSCLSGCYLEDGTPYLYCGVM